MVVEPNGTTDPTIETLSLDAAAIDEYGVVTLTGTFTDADATDTHVVTIAWGDGSPNTVVDLSPGERTFTATHRYLDDNPSATPTDSYTISATVSDGRGDDSASRSVAVRNVAPVLASLTNNSTSSCDAALMGADAVTISATFTDIGQLDSHTAKIDWGDGVITSGVVVESSGTGTITASHVYAEAGSYVIRVTLADDDTGTAERTTNAVVAGIEVVDGQLLIHGTSARDIVHVNMTGNGADARLHVTANFRAAGGAGLNLFLPASTISQIVLRGCDGDDHLQVTQGVAIPATIYGDAGNDDLWGGGGPATIIDLLGDNDVHSLHFATSIVTGPGRDRIWTGSSNDVIQAGDGNNNIQAGAGADTIQTGSGNDTIDAGDGDDLVWAGGGNDNGAGGNDLLLGEAGHDELTGGQDRDILIGGLGADRLVGDVGDDVLIAGYTSYDSDAAALVAIRSEWTSVRTYAQRTANLLAGTGLAAGRKLIGDDGSQQTVFNDHDVDTLTGRSGQDWFLANKLADNGGPLDTITDLALNELYGDIDF